MFCTTHIHINWTPISASEEQKMEDLNAYAILTVLVILETKKKGY